MRVNASPRVTALNSSIHPTFKHPFFKSFRAREGDKKIRAGLNDIGGRYFIPIVGRGKKIFIRREEPWSEAEREIICFCVPSAILSAGNLDQGGSSDVKRRE